jgi:hypothetical protein
MNIFVVTLFVIITLIIDRINQKLKKLFNCNMNVTLLIIVNENNKIF